MWHDAVKKFIAFLEAVIVILRAELDGKSSNPGDGNPGGGGEMP